jgi:uncharacterized protein YeeX (DUF496 family)
MSETERLNLKSEYEVRLDILIKENAFLKEEKRKIVTTVKDREQKM